MKETQSPFYKKAAIAFLLFVIAFGLFSSRTKIKTAFNSLFSSHYVHKSIEKQQHSNKPLTVVPTTPVINKPSNKILPSVHMCKNQYGDNYEVAILEYNPNPKVKLPAGFNGGKNKIVAVKVRIHNYGIHPIAIGTYNFTLKDYTNYKYNSYPIINEKSQLPFINLDPDSTQEGWIFYPVPEKVVQTHVPLSLIYADNFTKVFEARLNQ